MKKTNIDLSFINDLINSHIDGYSKDYIATEFDDKFIEGITDRYLESIRISQRIVALTKLQTAIKEFIKDINQQE